MEKNVHVVGNLQRKRGPVAAGWSILGWLRQGGICCGNYKEVAYCPQRHHRN